MKHRFVDLDEVVGRIIPYVLHNDTDLHSSIWMNRHGVGPAELVNTRMSTATFASQVVDPMLSPDQQSVVYGTIPATGTDNHVRIIPADDSDTPDTIATSPNDAASSPFHGVDISMQPSWHPDGSKIIYRTTRQNTVLDPSPRESHVRSVEPDGSNDTLLVTNDMDVEGRIWWPQYNFDGSRIGMICASDAAGGDIRLATCDADGSNFTFIATIYTTISGGINRVPFAWANTSDQLVFYRWTDDTVRTIDGDGSNDTSIYTDPGPFWGTMKVTWLPDDSEIVYSKFTTALSAPKHEIGTLDPGGGGFTAFSGPRRWYGGNQSSYPRLFPQDGRIWVQDGNTSTDVVVASMLSDGSDYTVEHDVDDTDYSWTTGFSHHG